MSDDFEIDESVLKAVKKQALIMAKKFVPEDHGDLKKSITGRVAHNEVILESDCEYAGFVEYGTKRMVRAHGPHSITKPVVNWKAKTKRGDIDTQQMPYLRPALYVTAKQMDKFIPKELLVNVEMVIR